MTPPQLFLIKEQIIIPFGFPFALFGNWKKVILTEATVLIFWLYLIRQTVCPKKYTLEVSLDRCVWSVLISELYSLSPLSTKKYSTFLLLSQFISQESSDQIIFLNFRLQFYKNTNMNRPSPNPFRLEWYMSDMFRFCVQDSNQKKSQRTSWSSKKKILRKMTWNPNQSFVHRDYSKKKSRLLSTTFSRYFTISNSNKIIPFFSSTTTPTQLFLPLFSVFGRHPVDCYYPHSVKN